MAATVTLPAQLDKLIPKPIQDIYCQTLLQYQPPPLSGVLRKEPEDKLSRLTTGTSFGFKWPHRFVVLYKGCVYIYKNECAQKYERATSLFGYDRVVAEDELIGLPWVFKIVNSLTDREKTLRFSAGCEQTRNEWMERLNKEMLACNAPLLARQSDNVSNVPLLRLSHSDKKRLSSMIDAADDLEYVCMESPRGAPTGEEGDEQSMYDDMAVSKTDWCVKPSASEPPKKPPPIERKPHSPTTGNASTNKTKIENRFQMPCIGELSAKCKSMSVDETHNGDQPIYDDIKESDTTPFKKEPAPPPGSRSGPQSKLRQQRSSADGEDSDMSSAVNHSRCPQPPTTVPKPKTTTKPVFTSKNLANNNAATSADPESATNSVKKTTNPTATRNKLPTPPKPTLSPPAKPVERIELEPLNTRVVPPAPPPNAPCYISNNGESEDELDESYCGYNNKSDACSESEEFSTLTDADCQRDFMAKVAFTKEDSARCSEIMSKCTQEGAYMIRNATREDDTAKTLMVRTYVPSRYVAKFRLAKTKSGRYTLRLTQQQSESFQSISALLRHYQNNNLPGRTTTLSVPYTADNS